VGSGKNKGLQSNYMSFDSVEKIIVLAVIVAMFLVAFLQESSEKKELKKKDDA